MESTRGLPVSLLEHGDPGPATATHCSDPNFLCYIRALINIDFVEVYLGSRRGEFLEHRGDDSAWSTPSSPEIDQGWSAPVDLLVISERS